MTMNIDPASAADIGAIFAQLNSEHGEEAGATFLLMDLIYNKYISMRHEGVPRDTAELMARIAITALHKLTRHCLDDAQMEDITDKLGQVYEVLQRLESDNDTTTEKKEASNG